MAGMVAPQLAHDSPAQALAYLRYHWSEAFEISRTPRVWTARRRDTGEVLHATDPDELLTMIRAESPVAR